ncbi:MAG: class I SAM-dependent methyltransferase [Candidatus Roizmanbacteria bacterium]|nr:class I SAM-dependent methyltransferase [Candidatus Roizmanbacteria bacterium]
MPEAVFHSHHPSETVEVAGLRIPQIFQPHVIEQNEPGTLAVALPTDFWGTDATKTYEDPRYFSGQHGAYQEGYDLETRVAKYRDAIETTAAVWREHPGKYIDFGGGPGYFAWGVAQEAIKLGILKPEDVPQKVFVADVSSISDEHVAQSEIQRIQTTLSDLPDQHRKGEFSIASCLHTMEHIPREHVVPSIEAMYQAIAAHGVLYLIIPTLDGRIQKPENKALYEQIMFDKTHVIFGTRNWWKKQFRNVGFQESAELEALYDSRGYGWVFCFTKPDASSALNTPREPNTV